MPTIQKITTFLAFDANAEEAVAFYTSIFKNSRVVSTTRYGADMPKPAGTVMTIVFELAGHQFIALNAGPNFKFSEAVSLAVQCDTQAEIDEYWDKLTSGGGSPIQCGWLKDKFGLCWQIMPAAQFDWISRDPATRDRVMHALVQMVKLDLATLKTAAEGS